MCGCGCVFNQHIRKLFGKVILYPSGQNGNENPSNPIELREREKIIRKFPKLNPNDVFTPIVAE